MCSELPDKLEGWGTELCMAVLGKKLAVVNYYSWRKQIFDVWVMEEYVLVGSWRKMHTVDMMGKIMEFVGFTREIYFG